MNINIRMKEISPINRFLITAGGVYVVWYILYEAQFLKIGADARGTAMGNAFTAMSGDIGSMYWNPAGLATINNMETVFVNANWIAGINFNYTAFAINLNQLGVIGFSMTNLSVPEDDVRTVAQPNGTGEFFDANDLSMNLAYAKKLTDKFSMGGNLKWSVSKSGMPAQPHLQQILALSL